jgi:subtilisin family serine protease
MSESGAPEGPNVDEERRQRARDQVQLIVDSFARDGVEIGFGDDDGPVDDPADFKYLYRRQTLLAVEEDLGPVQKLLGRRGEVQEQAFGAARLEIRSGVDLHELLREFDDTLGVGVVTPEHVLYVTPGAGSCCPATEPEETSASRPYPDVTGRQTDGSGVVVSVVDVGWHPPAATDPISPWLAGVTGDDESLDLDDIPAYGGHGTFVAGVVRCFAPEAVVQVEGFLVHAGASFELDVVAQLVEGLAIKPDIISLSAGTYTRMDRSLLGFDRFYKDYLSKLKNTVLVAAAGNDGTDSEFWPAASDWALGVGALDAAGQRADFSNFGRWVDLYALGVDLVNAFPHGTFFTKEETSGPPAVKIGERRTFKGLARWSGTSFATPLVAGKIAAQMSRTGQTAPAAAAELLAVTRGLSVPQGSP